MRITTEQFSLFFVVSLAFNGCVADTDENTLCGNGAIDPGEECDGTDLQSMGCIDFGYTGGFLTCSSDCRLNLMDCQGSASCGNGLVESIEECDGASLEGMKCADLGYTGGTLSCTAGCVFDTSSCTESTLCGNGAIDPGEECDGPNLEGMECTDLDYTGGTLFCADNCTFDTSSCTGFTLCGNGAIDPDEECDATLLNGKLCTDFGYESGTLSCATDCKFDIADCTGMGICGNDQIDASEDCDGAELAGATCQSLGFTGGMLSCSDACAYDTAGCNACGNGVLDEDEVCDGDAMDCRVLNFDFETGNANCLDDCMGYDESPCTEIVNIALEGMAASIQQGAKITGAAHMEIMGLNLVGLYEWQVKEFIDTAFDAGGGDPLDAFDHVVASGPNTLTLHYFDGDRQIQDGDLLLMDLGARYEGYCSDISRTIPANGTFTPRQRELYQLVLDAQTAVAEAMVPEVHSLSDMTQWTKNFFRASPLRARDRNGVERTMDVFFIHSISHYVGADVHGSDLNYRDSEPVAVGRVFTIEPGLYVESEGIGIRIEDDYIMTDTGAVNIYKNTIKTVEEIEQFMAQPKFSASVVPYPETSEHDPLRRRGLYSDHMDF